MQKPIDVWIHGENQITFGTEREVHGVEASGQYFANTSAHYLTYPELHEQGSVDVRVKITPDEGIVIRRRQGHYATTMPLTLKHKENFLYSGLKMGSYLEQLDWRLAADNSGLLLASYRLFYETGALLGRYRLTLQFEPKVVE